MKKNILLAIVAFITMGIVVISCSKKSEDVMTPNPPASGGGDPTCDTTNSKYTTDVVPILQANCYSCHGSATNSGSGGIVLEDFDVISGFAANGTLIGVITHAAGFNPMPRGGAKLSDCDINTIRSWINNGIQNN